MKYEKYLITKKKVDLLSSLKALDEKIIKKKLKEYDLNNINELKEYILDSFKECLDMSKYDEFTRIYFQRLLANENSEWITTYQDDIESLFVFIYKKGNHYSYYIPDEIKKIIEYTFNNISLEEIFNLENAANTPIIKDLKELLNALVVDDLKQIGHLFHINKLSNKPKKELVKTIYETLTNKNKLSELIEKLIDKEFDLLKELIHNNGIIQNNHVNVERYHLLYISGIVFLFQRDNKFYISMPQDIYSILKKIELNKFEKIIEKNTKAYNLVRAMVELYGVITPTELEFVYSEFYGEEKNLDFLYKVLSFCNRWDNIEQIQKRHKTYFVNRILNDNRLEPILNDIIKRQNEIKRKPIKLEELVKYTDYNYYENNESKRKFKKYLKRKGLPDTIIEEIIISISQMYRLGNSFISVTIEMLEDYRIEITEKNIEEILNYLTDIYNNTRIWTNNGWTPIEMRKNYN